MDGYRGSETRTSSEPSGLTGDESGESAQQDSSVTESVPTEWTDEKHNLYLKSMEASFVNQLYNSMDLHSWRTPNEISVPRFSQRVNSTACAPSGQFKVLRRGCWQKVNFLRPESRPNLAYESNYLLTSPWIQHFRSTRKSQAAESPTLQESIAPPNEAINLSGKKKISGRASTSSNHCLCNSHSRHHDLVEGNTEMSDQNFVDEDIKGKKASSTCSSKRMKTQTTDASTSDQVVPYGKPPATEDVTDKCISAAR